MSIKRLNITLIGVLALLLSGVGFAAGNQSRTVNMFGGPAYLGAPNLQLTAAFLKAGSGADGFSTAQALVAMVGEKTVKAEVAKLTKQYGEEKVNNWLKGTDAVIADALKHASDAGVTLPAAPAELTGTALAVALVKAGLAEDGTFWSGRLYDKLVSHDIHNAVMADVNKNPSLGLAYDQNVHRITNQAFYDVAQALGHKDVKLASLH